MSANAQAGGVAHVGACELAVPVSHLSGLALGILFFFFVCGGKCSGVEHRGLWSQPLVSGEGGVAGEDWGWGL